MGGEEEMKKEGENYVDGNVTYLGRDYAEAESVLELKGIHPEIKEHYANILLGGNGTLPEKNYKERFSFIKRLNQWLNKRNLEAHATEIVYSGNVIDLSLHGLPLERQVALLDIDLSSDIGMYVSEVAEGILDVYEGLDSPLFQAFAQELLHPLEVKTYTYNLEENPISLGRLNWGIALVVNRRWMPLHNVERYRSAKKFYEIQLKGKVFSPFERFMEYLEEKIVSNPLFVYVTAEEDKE